LAAKAAKIVSIQMIPFVPKMTAVVAFLQQSKKWNENFTCWHHSGLGTAILNDAWWHVRGDGWGSSFSWVIRVFYFRKKEVGSSNWRKILEKKICFFLNFFEPVFEKKILKLLKSFFQSFHFRLFLISNAYLGNVDNPFSLLILFDAVTA
jgi:hypothetical protein